MRWFRSLEASLRHRIWWHLPRDAPWWYRLGVQGGRLIHALSADLASGALTLRAMSLVFTSLLAFVPLLAVSFSVLQGFGVHNRIEPVLRGFLAPLGPRADGLAERIVGFVDNVDVGVLGAIGVALLLFAAVSLVQKIEAAFNYTWNVSRRRTLVRQFADYFSVLVIGPVLVFLALGITASLTSSTVVKAIMAVEPMGSLVQLASVLMPYLLVIAAFTFFYVLIPNTRVRLSAALFGGAIAGLIWQTLGKLFAAVVVTSTNFTAIYSSFAILLLFIIWLNLSWLVLLIGSSLAFYYQFPQYLAAGGRTSAHLSPAQAEALGLGVAIAVVRAWDEGDDPLDREQLASRLGVPVQPMDAALAALSQRGLLAPTGAEGSAYLPGVPPDKTPAKRLLDAIRHEGGGVIQPQQMPSGHRRLLASIERGLVQGCDELTWADVARSTDLENEASQTGSAGRGNSP